MKVEGLNTLPLKIDQETQINSQEKQSFADILKNFIQDVNNDLLTAKQVGQDLAVGKVENIQEAMYLIEKADISFKLLTEIRNKALEAYQEIMRMQV
ncbi:flagellar hook-basal body complex protein FliE [Sulfurihydrogenibium azorense Az-Fu1]|jgi:flagellar hook-basal body complex protein FliE|uniref:Flagellar hook-basal body complex protein FliE n=1 Tax=Sulfurihydrogenibium azorense (strain DSM 15241 / OCM 825 / Az-Fu1) TaxID=204536 RepID=C1DW25_SULAA|nr:flagellar hook-basal body complex protein FliE [Sulfurihydrogenibium azorense]ACN99397.1 flagellar hook-basal body complex protein FliE [Sulfurihydrogenibium azorense Az-Fu1]